MEGREDLQLPDAYISGGTIPPSLPWLILTGRKEAVIETNLLCL